MAERDFWILFLHETKLKINYDFKKCVNMQGRGERKSYLRVSSTFGVVMKIYFLIASY